MPTSWSIPRSGSASIRRSASRISTTWASVSAPSWHRLGSASRAMARSLLVTGASGFLGAHVCREAAKARWRVVAGVRRNSNLARLDALCPAALRAECSPETNLGDLLARNPVDAIVHCAAYGVDYRQSDPGVAIDTNVKFSTSLVLAAAAAKLARFIYVGTCYEYGTHGGAI